MLRFYPWSRVETGESISMGDTEMDRGIENAKINISLRIFSNKWHVYAGLAITNPSAHDQVLQYSKSTTELFTLMIQGKRKS